MKPVIRYLTRLDVLVEAQHIIWIVLSLDRRQASIVGTIRSLDQRFARFTQLVRVHSTSKRSQFVP